MIPTDAQAGQRIVVTGATGNVGTSVVRALSGDTRVARVVGVARRTPDQKPPRVQWTAADVADAELDPILAGADTLVHAAWHLQAAADAATSHRTNIVGTRRVLQAAVRTGVATVVYLSSASVYSPSDTGLAVTEDDPTDGRPSSLYATEKAYVERMLDGFEAQHPEIRVVRLRPGMAAKGSAGAAMRRFYGLASVVTPWPLFRRMSLPLVGLPDVEFQVVHTDDLAQAVRASIFVTAATGAFNIATTPVVDRTVLAEIFGARIVPVPHRAVRAGIRLTHALRLQPLDPGWFDLLVASPSMSTARAQAVLDWRPQYPATEALTELLEGFMSGAGDTVATNR